MTSTQQNGAMGPGLAGADGICQTRATAAGLPGTYKAWLSACIASPSTRFRCRAASCSAQGYRRVHAAQTLIATDWVDLTDGILLHAINVTEFGEESSGIRGLDEHGTDGIAVRLDMTDLINCTGWTDGDQGLIQGYTGANAAFGVPVDVLTQPLCTSSHRLYCFQQA